MEANETTRQATLHETLEVLSIRQLKALLCFQTLQMMATRKQTVNYETLAIMLGMPSQGNALASAISPVLYDVFNFCVEAKLPHLTVLVVRKSGRDRDLPGPGFWKVYRPGEELTLLQKVEFTEEETAKCFRLFEKLGAS
ncbi:hypothetical protein D3C78_337640 [compost metagenome]